MNFKLGKKPYVKSHKDFLYKNYRNPALPAVPSSFGHQNLVSVWGMLGNDTVGDCVIAGADHAVMLWSAEGSGTPAQFTAQNALSDYSAITGYNPNNPNSDQGTVIRDALDYHRNTGMIDATGKRHKIGAYLSLDITNFSEVLEAAYLFGVVKIGIQLPSSATSQFTQSLPWTVVEGSAIEGGHDVEIVGYDGSWIYVVTWGKVQKMSVEFFQKYCDEAWVALSTEILNGNGLSPEGFNLAQLQADLDALPNVQPTPVPDKVYTLTAKTDKSSYSTNELIMLTVTTSEPNQTITMVISQPGSTVNKDFTTNNSGVLSLPFVESSSGIFNAQVAWMAPDGVTHTTSASATIHDLTDNYQLSVDNTSVNAPINADLKIKVKLTNNNAGLANQAIQSMYSGVLSGGCGATTNSDGIATFTVNSPTLGNAIAKFIWFNAGTQYSVVVNINFIDGQPNPPEPTTLTHVQSLPYLDLAKAQERVAYYEAKGVKPYLVHVLQFGAFSSEKNAENEQAKRLKEDDEKTYLADY
ncbi:hypothetical protein [Desulfosporosinus sp. FKA]|uniref:hypothetical protein n=1 Tax=Desulfosporosinus sp. FKA TaxID=1969834 RepID=UPI000B499A95|nr:hypothetical protein [Desulfosporosinus sp. FKA]